MFNRLKERLRRFIYNEVKRAIEQAMLEESFNIEREIQRLAMQESAKYVIENLDLHLVQPDRLALLTHVLKLIPAEGLLLEFGVFSGLTLWHIAGQVPGRHVYGFDSFQGLAEPWLFHREGAFKLQQMPEAPENGTLVKGFFEDTSAEFLANHPGNIALLHIDCDLYSSCKYVFETYGHRIVPGTVIVFDDYFNRPGWRGGEYKVFRDWVEANGVGYEFVGFTGQRAAGPKQASSGHQVAVKILTRGEPGPHPPQADAAART